MVIRLTRALSTLAACGAASLLPQPAFAYLGGAFITVPGVAGRWNGADHRGWIRPEGHYWRTNDSTDFTGGRVNFQKRLFFSGPSAPATGGDDLVVSVAKTDPATVALMAMCKRQHRLPEMKVAESAEATRPSPELGPRPDTVPAWFEYRLKDVTMSCPVVAGAPEQAFVFRFASADWLNYAGPKAGVPLTLAPARSSPPVATGRTRSFVVSWIGSVADTDDKACPAMNGKPELPDYFAYLGDADREKAKADLARRGGGLDYARGTVSRRGPGFLNVCLLPGIVPAKPLALPAARIVDGLDLDGATTTRQSRAPLLARSYVAPDGRKGIDNQLYTATACVAGLRGRKGFVEQYGNEEMRNGFVSILLSVSGIDDDRNDDSVDVTFFYSKDPMAKSATGKDILPDFSFRITPEPQFAAFTRRLRGRIVNGVIETDPVEQLQINRSYAQLSTIHDARLRLQPQADGSLKGLVGGYIDWRQFAMFSVNGQNEHLSGFQCPSLYQALKRSADGMRNPDTGEFDGISVAYELDGRAAMIAPSEIARYYRADYAGK